MGKQSSRLIYRGNDHKDIYYRGHYHDAMYKGMERIWHKIRKEGYYSIIIKTKSRRMIVINFSEKTKKFEEVLRIENNIESPAYYVSLCATMDRERIYVTTLGMDSLIAVSTDGINFGNTNLEYDEAARPEIEYPFFLSPQYYKDYMWIIHKPGYGYPSGVYIYYLRFYDGIYSLEYKYVSMGIGEAGNFYGEYRKKKLAFAYKTSSSSGMFEIYCYDTENLKLEKKFEFSPSSWSVTGKQFVANDTYIFFAEKEYKKDGPWSHYERYVYYSFGGETFNNSLIDETSPMAGHLSEYYENDLPDYILYREGMYYIYCTPGSHDTRDTYRVVLTTDFKNFRTKKLKDYVEIEGKTFSVRKMNLIEQSPTDLFQYFFNGEYSIPEDGMLLWNNEETNAKKYLCYIDNMFFYESNGNRFIEIDTDY